MAQHREDQGRRSELTAVSLANMPALPDVANVFRTRVMFTVHGKPDQGLRLFFRWTGSTPTSASLNDMSGTVLLAIGGFADLWHPDVKLTSVTMEDLTSPTAAVGENTTTVPGTRTGGPLPADACVVVDSTIPRRYRGGRPKTFWPFGTDTDLTGQQKFSSTAVGVFGSGIASIFHAFSLITVDGTTLGAQANISYYKGFTVITSPTTHRARNLPTLRTTPVVDTVTDRTVQSYVGSQRRRRLSPGS